MSLLAPLPRWAGRSEDCACALRGGGSGGGGYACAVGGAWLLYLLCPPGSSQSCPAGVVLLVSYLVVESRCRLGARVRVVMASYEYVSPEQLAGFDKYKYSAVDTNPLSLYVMHPFWNTVVKVFPTWLAPNLITFSGSLLVVFNFLLLAYFDPDFYASAAGHKHVPDWVWIVVGTSASWPAL